MAITQYTSISSYVNTVYERALFVAREQNLMTNLVRNFSATGWMSRVIPTRPNITAETVADAVDYSNATTFGKSTAATLTPGEIIAQVVLTDQAYETDPDNLRNDASLELGNAVATKIDTDLVGSFSSFTKDMGNGAGATATLAKFAAAIAYLRNAKAPAPIYIVCHPYHWHDIWNNLGQPAATYANMDALTSQALRDYYVMDLISARWFVSANISVDANDDAISGVFNPQALGFDSRRAPRLEAERDASLRGWELNMTAGYAYGVIRNGYGVKFTADATEPS